MVFSSYLFIFFFLPLALLGYYAAPKKLRHLTLTIFSYIFYGWANPWFCLLMLFNTSVDYTNGRLMEKFKKELAIKQIVVYIIMTNSSGTINLKTLVKSIE